MSRNSLYIIPIALTFLIVVMGNSVKYVIKRGDQEMENKNKKDMMDWFDTHVIVMGQDKKTNNKIQNKLKEKLAKDLDKEGK